MAKSQKHTTAGLKTRKVRTTSTGWKIKYIGNRLDQAMKQELKQLDLTMDQFVIMMTLLEQDGLTQAQLGEKVILPGYAITRNLDKLAGDGYLRRDKHAHSRRSHSIRLTEKGLKLAPALFDVVKRVNQNLLASLPKSEAKKFNQTLDKLVEVYRG